MFYPAILWFWELIKVVKYILVLIGHGHNKAFHVEPQKETSTVKLWHQMTPLKTIRAKLVSIIFRQFGRCVGHFDIAG